MAAIMGGLARLLLMTSSGVLGSRREQTQFSNGALVSEAHRTNVTLGFSWSDVESFVQPVKRHIVDPLLPVIHGTAAAAVAAASVAVQKGAAWAAGAAIDTVEWTAGAAEDVTHWTELASKECVKWGTTAAGDIGRWTGNACDDIVSWTVQASNDVTKWTGEALEDIQEFAEEVGKFVTDLGKSAIEWFEELMRKFTNEIGGWIKNQLGTRTVCGIDQFPLISKGEAENNSCINLVVTTAETLVKSISGLGKTVNGLGSVLANVMADGDMYAAIFGLLGKEAVNAVERVFSGNFDRLHESTLAYSVLSGSILEHGRTVIKIVSTYFRKHATMFAHEIMPVINDVKRSIEDMGSSLEEMIQSFVSDSSLVQLGNTTDPQKLSLVQQAARGWDRKTWYIALCGSAAGNASVMGVCIYYPFEIGKFPNPRDIVFEFSAGVTVEGPGEVSGGLKFGPIFTNDLGSLSGPALGFGIDVDLGNSFGAQFAFDAGFTFSRDPMGQLVSLDIEGGMGMGINKGVGLNIVNSDWGDVSPVYAEAFGVLPLENLPDLTTIPHDVLEATTRGASEGNALLENPQWDPFGIAQAISQAGDITAHAAATQPLSNKQVKAVTSASGLAESAIDHKYALLNGPCLPGQAILSGEECEYAYNKLQRRGIFAYRGTFSKGSWDNIPWACSIKIKGSNLATSQNPHFNWNPRTNNHQAVIGNYGTICRRAFRLLAPQESACPGGTAIVSARECWNAYVELQGNFKYAPKRGLQKSSWDALPPRCSIQYQGHFVDSHQDQSPHWNEADAGSAHRARSGEFRTICKPQRFWIEDAGEASCPWGSVIEDPDLCIDAYRALQIKFRHPAKRALVAAPGGYNQLPFGCSVQYEGDFVTANKDMTPHFNTDSRTHATRSKSGEFVNLCKEPSYWMTTAMGCPEGLDITDEFVCKAAYEALRNEFEFVSKRGMQSGTWDGRHGEPPRSCSVQQAGSYVTENHDASPHFNHQHLALAYGATTGEYRPLCLPGKYFMAKPGSTRCHSDAFGSGYNGGTAFGITTEEECQIAFASFGRQFVFPAKRGMQNLFHDAVPHQCSVHYSGGYVNDNKDQSPHFNTNANASGSRGLSHEFIPICRSTWKVNWEP